MKLYDREEPQLDGATRKYIVLELDYRELNIIDTALAELQLQVGKREMTDKNAKDHMRAFRSKIEDIREHTFARVVRGEKNLH